MHGISTHFPNAVHFFVIAAERSTIVYWRILVVHFYVVHTDTFIGNNVNVAKSFTVAECVAVGCRKLNSVQGFTMLGIQCFFRTFAIIDIHRTVSFQLFQYKITECLAPEIVKYAISFSFWCYCFHWFSGQLIKRRTLFFGVKVPTIGILINCGWGVTCFSTFINPLLVFISDSPCTIALYSFSIYKNSRWRSLIPQFDIKTVYSCRKFEPCGHTKL